MSLASLPPIFFRLEAIALLTAAAQYPGRQLQEAQGEGALLAIGAFLGSGGDHRPAHLRYQISRGMQYLISIIFQWVLLS